MSRFSDGREEELIKFSIALTDGINEIFKQDSYKLLTKSLKKRYRGMDEEKLKEWV